MLESDLGGVSKRGLERITPTRIISHLDNRLASDLASASPFPCTKGTIIIGVFKALEAVMMTSRSRGIPYVMREKGGGGERVRGGRRGGWERGNERRY